MKRFIKMLSTAVLSMTLSGCLWVCRVPMVQSAAYTEDGVCTNKVWSSMVASCRHDDPERNWFACGCYKTIKMRVFIWQHRLKPEDLNNYKGRDLAEAREKIRWFPLVWGLTWLGAPLDAAVETVLLPWDLTED